MLFSVFFELVVVVVVSWSVVLVGCFWHKPVIDLVFSDYDVINGVHGVNLWFDKM